MKWSVEERRSLTNYYWLWGGAHQIFRKFDHQPEVGNCRIFRPSILTRNKVRKVEWIVVLAHGLMTGKISVAIGLQGCAGTRLYRWLGERRPCTFIFRRTYLFVWYFPVSTERFSERVLDQGLNCNQKLRTRWNYPPLKLFCSLACISVLVCALVLPWLDFPSENEFVLHIAHCIVSIRL